MERVLPPPCTLIYVIVAGAVATYLTRVGGYVLMTRMKSDTAARGSRH